jgi:hypothetical protein
MIVPFTVSVALADDLHDFDTIEVKFESSVDDITEYVDEPESKYRAAILNELRDIRMWKAGLNNPNGGSYEVEIGTIMIDSETGDLVNKDIEKTSHHSI